MDRERIRFALSSARALASTIQDMEKDELIELLKVESASQRRVFHIETVISRLVALTSKEEREALNREFAPWLVKNQ